jgi:mono/diheme cytochrome c family protein
MTPGGNCIQCHATTGGEGPLFQLAGTVYPSAHEPANCNGANGNGPGGAVVVATGANGVEVRMPTNGVGNFAGWSTGLTFPYTARVEYQGRTRAMVAPQTNGDCNVCHTLAGTAGAPGRIMLP